MWTSGERFGGFGNGEISRQNSGRGQHCSLERAQTVADLGHVGKMLGKIVVLSPLVYAIRKEMPRQSESWELLACETMIV